MLSLDQNIESPRVYTSEEVKSGVVELFSHSKFVAGMNTFIGSEMSQKFISAGQQISNSYEFQRDIVHPFLLYLKDKSLTQLSSSGLEQLDVDQKYLFISNHRDIGLDSAFLNLHLFDQGFTTTQIAIGDNLIKHRVAELIFRINKSFVVHRSGAPRDLYRASLAMSHYIKSQVNQGLDSIWIAQREGRAKDGNDMTQLSLLKMLAMSKDKGSLQKHFNELNIVPVSIAYEYNPCDVFLTKEFIAKKNNPNYKKKFEDDMASILQGLKGEKGHVNIAFGKPIQFKELSTAKKDKDVIADLAGLIDRQIHNNYRLSAINHFAFQKIFPQAPKMIDLDNAQRDYSKSYFKERIATFAKSDQEAAADYIYRMYANPVLNRMAL